jgi:hypothetical protein
MPQSNYEKTSGNDPPRTQERTRGYLTVLEISNSCENNGNEGNAAVAAPKGIIKYENSYEGHGNNANKR